MTLLNPAKSMVVNDVQPDKKWCPRLVTLPNPTKLMVVNDMQPAKKLTPRLMTLLNPAKSMEVNSKQDDKKPSPRLMTLSNPAKLNGSKVRNDAQFSRKYAPIVVTLRNPDKLIDSNDEHSYKKLSPMAVTAKGALRSRLRKSVCARKLFGIAVTTSACRNNCATSGSSTLASLAGVRSVSPNA